VNKWDEAKRLTFNKMCRAARNGQHCDHPACMEAQSVLKELDAGVFSDLARTVLTNRLCLDARQGNNCGHQACIDIKKTLDAF